MHTYLGIVTERCCNDAIRIVQLTELQIGSGKKWLIKSCVSALPDRIEMLDACQKLSIARRRDLDILTEALLR